MKKSVKSFMRQSIMLLLMGIAISACGPTISPDITYNFMFKPSFTEWNGHSITNVFLCGTFNSWNETASHMSFVSDLDAYIVNHPLDTGTYTYKYKVILDNGGVLWFADKLAPRSVDDGFGGLNSVIIEPDAAAEIFNVEFQIPAAVEDYFLIYWMFDQNDDSWQYVDLANMNSSGVHSCEFASSSEHFYEIDVRSTDTNYFGIFWYAFAGTTMNTNIGMLPLSYDNSSLDPVDHQTISKTGAAISWDLPLNLGTVTNVLLVFQNTNASQSSDYIVTNIGVTNEITLDIAVNGGGSEYLYFVQFYSDKGFIARTQYKYLIIN